MIKNWKAWQSYLSTSLCYLSGQVVVGNDRLTIFRNASHREPMAWVLHADPDDSQWEQARKAGVEFVAVGAPDAATVFHLGAYEGERRCVPTLPTWTPRVDRSALLPRNTILPPFRTEDQVRAAFQDCHRAIYKALANDPAAAFDMLLCVIAAKVHDELAETPSLHFAEVRGEDPQVTQDRLHGLLGAAEQWLDDADSRVSFPPLPPSVAVAVLRAFQDYSLVLTATSAAGTDILGNAYESIVGATFRGELGSYFTPRNIADFMVRLLRLSPGSVFDPACGSAGLLLAVRRLAGLDGNADDLSFYGNDLNPRMVRTARVNFLLHNIDPQHVLRGNGLDLDRMMTEFGRTVNSEGYWWDNAAPDGFDAVLANPPFAGHESDPAFLTRAQAARREDGTIRTLNRTLPFIEMIVGSLKIGGVSGLVIPTSILNAEEDSFVRLRELLLDRTEILAIIGLPEKAFVHTDCGVHGALLFFKRVEKPREQYDVFVDWAHNLGYDRLGKYRRENDLPGIVAKYHAPAWPTKNTFPVEFLRLQGRLDPAWLRVARSMPDASDEAMYVNLTELVEVRPARFTRRTLQDDSTYRIFEVADTNLITGRIETVHKITGFELRKKGRIKNQVASGDLLLPNHRDSLIAKGAPTGRSAVIVDAEHNGVLTTDRFLVLKPLIDPRLAQALLNSAGVRRQIVAQCRGAASLDIREKTLQSVRVPRVLLEGPTAAEVMEISSEAEEARERLEKLRVGMAALLDGAFGSSDFRPEAHRVL